jgi:hypothetical protein
VVPPMPIHRGHLGAPTIKIVERRGASAGRGSPGDRRRSRDREGCRATNERRLRRYGLQWFGRRKDEARAANGKMKLFLLRLLRVAAQIRKMIDVADEFDLLLLDGVLFHKRERIVAAMDAGKIEICEIF